jgi:hypothetical protein
MAQNPAQLRETAMRLLQDALRKPPTELKSEVDDAERAVVALRDELIERLRQAPTDAVRAALEQVNVSLSLIVGLEYPLGGLQRQMLDQARTALERAIPGPM